MAVVYTNGIAADRFLADVGYAIRSAGASIAGLVQLNSFERDPGKCDMIIEELYSGTLLQLSEDRGGQAQGCRLDRAVLAQAAGLLLSALEQRPDIVILNKFGKTEAEGSGLRDVIAQAAEQGVPVLVGVPFRNLDQWRAFAGSLAVETEVDPVAVRSWLASHQIVGPESMQVSRQSVGLVGRNAPAPRDFQH